MGPTGLNSLVPASHCSAHGQESVSLLLSHCLQVRVPQGWQRKGVSRWQASEETLTAELTKALPQPRPPQTKQEAARVWAVSSSGPGAPGHAAHRQRGGFATSIAPASHALIIFCFNGSSVVNYLQASNPNLIFHT